MPNFTKRATEPEIIDDFSLNAAEINPLLHGLEMVNTFLGGYEVIFSAIKEVSVQDNFHINDWGCGGGDVLRMIFRKLKNQNQNLTFTGIDATPAAVNFAIRNNTEPNIKFILANVFSEEVSRLKSDLVISSSFTHHFNDQNWILLIQKMMSCSKHAVIIDDLHRHWLPYYSVMLITKVLTRSRLARNDGPLSVLKGFTKPELKILLQKAGVQHYTIRWKWAFRWQIVLYKN